MTSILKVDNIHTSGGTSAMTIDSTGRVLMPVVPAWRVTKSVVQAVSTTAETAVTFQSSSGQNCFVNGGVTLTNNKIVVPVAGIYQVSVNLRVDNVTSGYLVTRILKNLDQSGQEETYHIHSVNGGAYNTATLVDVFQADAGDEFSVSNLSSSDNSYSISNASIFSGHLVG